MHRTGELYGQYKTLEQQKETASLGMWIFLVQEILFFGGIFLAYSINRHLYPTAFGIGGNMLSLPLGFANTVVLIASSFTMAMSVWSAQTSKKQLVPIFLILTLILGCVFLGVKVKEYKDKFDHHLIPGHGFDRVGREAIEAVVISRPTCGYVGLRPVCYRDVRWVDGVCARRTAGRRRGGTGRIGEPFSRS